VCVREAAGRIIRMTRSTKAGLMPGLQAGTAWRVLGICAVALVTANCAQNPQQTLAGPSGSGVDPKYGVKASPRLYNEGDVIPKGGGRRFSGKPYVVAGRTYVPRENAKGYVREGLASWYGAAFHGRMTANGEVFDRHSIAAAHPTLPLPSYARVTNLANHRSMIVRVNDRGPYHADRVMDVSEEVAQALEFHRSGTSRVRVEYVGKASTAGSDDSKLLATLRTDGLPAAIGTRSPVMLADLGPDAAEPAARESATPEPSAGERLTRGRSALAFKPAGEEAREEAETVRPARPAPVLMARAAGVAVPAALQPTAARETAFKPVAPIRVASASSVRARPTTHESDGAQRTSGRMRATAQPLTRTAAAWAPPAMPGRDQGKDSNKGHGKAGAPVPVAVVARAVASAGTAGPGKGAAPKGLAAAPVAARPTAPVKAVVTARAPAPPVKLAATKAPVGKVAVEKVPSGKVGAGKAVAGTAKPTRARVAEAR
jgi:rare lipoprotein A